MTISDGFSITQPVSLWNREIGTDFKKFFLNLAAGSVNLAAHDWRSAGENALQALSAIGLAPHDCGARAWLLIHRALTEAVFQLVEESAGNFQHVAVDPETFGATLDQALENRSICLNRDFFSHPEHLPLLQDLQFSLSQWLEAGGHDPAQARCIAQRLPSYFVFALNNQWRKKSEEYECLQKKVDTPFTQAAAREQGWNHYRAWLQKQVNDPLFDESFSLQDIYVPLRGFYEASHEQSADLDGQSVRKHVVDLQTALLGWLHHAKPRDAVRVLCGGPGSGKSSFAKMFAAKIAYEGKVSLLFIPMHLFQFQADLVVAVQAFVAADPYFRDFIPLAGSDSNERLLIIFDGLDELAMQGDHASETARQFVEEVLRKTAQFNQRETCLQVLITERTPLCATSFNQFRLPGQILHTLSYCPLEEARQCMHDPDGLLQTDQRQSWWFSYGKAKGKDYQAMPPALDRESLAEITAQPLLNYLVALGLEGGRVDFSKESNLNVIYLDLVIGVFKRKYEGGRNPSTKGFEEKAFVRILEEIALAVWHGNGRIATVTEIESRCRFSRQHQSLDRFKQGTREGVTRLLTAFYFRKTGFNVGGEETFEFTHKSFAEFLTARRIVRLIRQLTDNLRLFCTNSEKGWDETMALTKWVEVCGQGALDDDLFAFLRREVVQYPKKKVREWQKQLSYLIGHLLKNGLPMVKLGLVTYKEMVDQAHHAEIALLAVLNACARHTDHRSPKFLTDTTTFGAWLGRLQGQRTNAQSGVLSWLSHLELSGSIFSLRDLHGADLQKSNLRGADLFFANLVGADLRGADLRNVDFWQANLVGADLRGADLRNVDLRQANLRGADLRDADLRNVDLQQVNLSSADLRGAHLLD